MKKSDQREFRRYCSRPERVVWATAEYEGQRSICPLGWKMNTSISPWIMAISVAPARFTHDLIANSGEFVLAWPGEDLADATLFCGTKSGRNVDKFAEQLMSARQITAKAIGVGTDIRLDSQEVAGGALAAYDRIVHLCTFRVSNGSGRTRATRIARVSRRFRR